jgi:hypothetical protein
MEAAMRPSATPATLQIHALRLALLLAALIVPNVSGVSAQGNLRTEEILRAFDALRADIAATAPAQLQPSFQAKVNAAEVALLIPAVQAAREVRRQACASVYVLTSLEHQARALSEQGPFTFDPAAIDRDVEVLVGFITGEIAPLTC